MKDIGGNIVPKALEKIIKSRRLIDQLRYFYKERVRAFGRFVENHPECAVNLDYIWVAEQADKIDQYIYENTPYRLCVICLDAGQPSAGCICKGKLWVTRQEHDDVLQELARNGAADRDPGHARRRSQPSGNRRPLSRDHGTGFRLPKRPWFGDTERLRKGHDARRASGVSQELFRPRESSPPGVGEEKSGEPVGDSPLYA